MLTLLLLFLFLSFFLCSLSPYLFSSAVIFSTGKDLFVTDKKPSQTSMLMRQLSTDQTGWEDSERRRIEQCGGHVVDGRINGILEPSRTIGDADLKRVVRSGLIANPVMTSFNPFEEWDDGFATMTLIVATDGLWDVIDSVEVGRLVRSYHAKGQTEFARLLAAEAAKRGSRDDITVLFAQYKRT